MGAMSSALKASGSAGRPKKLLIVRPDGIGDFLLFCAVLEAYHAFYRDHQIDLMCSPAVRELAEPIPFIRRIFCVNAAWDLCAPASIASFIKAWGIDYDTIIYPVYSRTFIGDMLVRFLRGRQKIAFDGNDSNDPSGERHKRNRYFTRIIAGEKKEKPELERNAEFLIRLGARIDQPWLRPRMWFLGDDSVRAEALMKEHGLAKGRYVAVFPGAGDPIRYWEDGKWRDFIRHLITLFPEQKVVLLGGQQDKKLVAGIAASAQNGGMVIDLSGKTTVRVLAKIIQSARLLVSTETSAVHIAASTGTPAVCVMGGGHFNRFYPYGDPVTHRAVYAKMDCYGCDWRCRYNEPLCMKAIEVASVESEIVALMGKRN